MLLDNMELQYLDPSLVWGYVGGVGQGLGDMRLEGKSILENVATGVGGVTEEIVEKRCRVALFNEFV